MMAWSAAGVHLRWVPEVGGRRRADLPELRPAQPLPRVPAVHEQIHDWSFGILRLCSANKESGTSSAVSFATGGDRQSTCCDSELQL